MLIDRRQLIYYTGASGIVLATSAVAQTNTSASPPRPPALDSARVKDFVIAGHGNLEKTRALLDQEPGLLNAEWDWGGGDWEMAIGGAGHMGRADVAEFLISGGARLD